MTNIVSKMKRSEIMSKIQSTNTKPELILRQALWAAGVRGWRLHAKTLPGRPDIIFPRFKIAIFIDGCFWHGCKACYRLPKSNVDYWIEKITSNMNRDIKNAALLQEQGWTVCRFWEHEIKKCPLKYVQRIITLIEIRRNELR